MRHSQLSSVQTEGCIEIGDISRYLQANIAAYIGPDRKNQRTKLDSLSLNQRAVHMKARKLVTIDKMKT